MLSGLVKGFELEEYNAKVITVSGSCKFSADFFRATPETIPIGLFSRAGNRPVTVWQDSYFSVWVCRV